VAHNDDQLLVGFHKFWNGKGDAPSSYVLIEKKTGLYMEVDDILPTSLGPQYKDTAVPKIQLGHCTLAEIVPIKRKRSK
jgi:hypothetical protein